MESVPAKKPKKVWHSLTKLLAVVWAEDQVLIQKRPSEGLMAGLWEFLNVEVATKKNHEAQLIHVLKEQWGIQGEVKETYPVIHHTYTSFKVTLHSFLIHCTQKPKLAKDTLRWVSPQELSSFSFSSAHKRIALLIQSSPLIGTNKKSS